MLVGIVSASCRSCREQIGEAIYQRILREWGPDSIWEYTVALIIGVKMNRVHIKLVPLADNETLLVKSDPETNLRLVWLCFDPL